MVRHAAGDAEVEPLNDALAVGDLAPDFQLDDQHGQTLRLSSYRGKSSVLLVFYPYAFTGTCSRELHDLQDNLEHLERRGVQVLAVSVDSRYSQRTFADREGFTYRLLADFWPHGEVAARFGVLSDDTGAAVRATFLIDTTGTIRWAVVLGIGEARDVDAYLAAVAEL